jgi:hypothetical protein
VLRADEANLVRPSAILQLKLDFGATYSSHAWLPSGAVPHPSPSHSGHEFLTAKARASCHTLAVAEPHEMVMGGLVFGIGAAPAGTAKVATAAATTKAAMRGFVKGIAPESGGTGQ